MFLGSVDTDFTVWSQVAATGNLNRQIKRDRLIPEGGHGLASASWAVLGGIKGDRGPERYSRDDIRSECYLRLRIDRAGDI